LRFSAVPEDVADEIGGTNLMNELEPGAALQPFEPVAKAAERESAKYRSKNANDFML
jgi:hypothetical protein